MKRNGGLRKLVLRGECSAEPMFHPRMSVARQPSGVATRTSRNRMHSAGSSAERGYDADHRRLLRDGWRCADCGWAPEIVEQFRRLGLGAPPTDRVLAELRHRHNRGERHLHADHQVPIVQRPDLRLDLDNLRTRCDRCHQ
jgi:hypothetical protein